LNSEVYQSPAWNLLKCEECIIKTATVSNGESIAEIKGFEQLSLYEFVHGDAILQEKLILDRAPDGMVPNTTLHMGGQFIGPHHGMMDEILVGHVCMGFRKPTTSKIFEKTALRMSLKRLRSAWHALSSLSLSLQAQAAFSLRPSMDCPSVLSINRLHAQSE
jgi:hypothetical protein